MANANVQEFTDGNFDSEVLSSKTPVLVDFWAEWCRPCRMLTPIIESVADQFVGKVKVGKVDTDANRETAAKYGINSIPTVIVFKNGVPVKTFVGLQKQEVIANHLSEVCG